MNPQELELRYSDNVERTTAMSFAPMLNEMAAFAGSPLSPEHSAHCKAQIDAIESWYDQFTPIACQFAFLGSPRLAIRLGQLIGAVRQLRGALGLAEMAAPAPPQQTAASQQPAPQQQTAPRQRTAPPQQTEPLQQIAPPADAGISYHQATPEEAAQARAFLNKFWSEHGLQTTEIRRPEDLATATTQLQERAREIDLAATKSMVDGIWANHELFKRKNVVPQAQFHMPPAPPSKR